MSDITYTDKGSIVRITPISATAKQWLENHAAFEEWQWVGRSLCIDWRCGALLLAAIEDAGFELVKSH